MPSYLFIDLIFLPVKNKLSKLRVFVGGAFDSAITHKRQRRKLQSVTTKREK